MSLKYTCLFKIFCCSFILLTMKQISIPALAQNNTEVSSVTEFPLPHHHTWGPLTILPGYNQDLWFTFQDASAIGRITTKGAITEYAANIVPGYHNANPINIAVDRADDVWFTGNNLVNDIGTLNNIIGRMTPEGTITRFHIPSGKSPSQLLLGPDSNIWFLEYSKEPDPQVYTGMGFITPTGKISEWPLPVSEIGSYAWGLDATLWVTEPSHDLLAHISSQGKLLKTYPFSYAISHLHLMPDGQLWFYFIDARTSSRFSYDILAGTISPKGLIHSISFTSYNGHLLDPKGIRGFTVDPAGEMWFSAVNTNQLMRYYPDMNVTIYQLSPHGGCGSNGICYPVGITTGPDHNIWFAELEGNRIGRIDLNKRP